MKKVIIVLAALMVISLFVVSGSQASAAEQTYTWKMAQYHPVGSMLDGMSKEFIRRVEEGSNGRISIRYYPGDLLGDYIVQQEAVTSGSLEFAYTGPVTKSSPKWDIFTMGYTGWNIEHGKDKFGVDGWMFEVWDDICKDCNWKLLSIAPGGSIIGGECVISSKSFDPLNPDGIKLRVMAADNLLVRWKALGYNPVIMPFSEISSALALNTIDASAGCTAQEFTVFGDAFNYAYALNDVQTAIPLIMNLKLWNSLSEEDQKLIMESADFTNDPNFGWDAWKVAVEKDYNNNLLPWQIIVTLDGDQWATLAEKARAAEWPAIEEKIGKELMDKIKANVPPLPWGKTLDEMNYGWGKIFTTEWLEARQGAVYSKNPPPVKK